YETFALSIKERGSFPPATSRVGGSGDDAARGLLVLCLVVLGDDAELLDRIERERVAATRVLARHATRCKIVLVARAIDEDVDVVRRKRPSCERLSSVVDPAALDVGARRQLDEIEEVAIRERQVFDLLA